MRFWLSFVLLFVSQIALGAEIFQIDASGFSGRDGSNGMDYRWSRAFDGYPGSPGWRGGDGQRGRDGGDAGLSSYGGDGGRIDAKLDWIGGQPGKALLTVSVNGGEARTKVIDVEAGDRVILSARGGAGGNGGLGGSGEEGGRGGKGGDADRFNKRAGDGGRGGDGGNAGRSTDGSNGGNGGRIQVILGDQALATVVRADVSGGRGGRAPVNMPVAGRAGEGGDPGNACFFGDNGYECGMQGMRGFRGMDGRPAYSNPRSGLDGSSGTATFSF